jgi:hypothetical protein
LVGDGWGRAGHRALLTVVVTEVDLWSTPRQESVRHPASSLLNRNGVPVIGQVPSAGRHHRNRPVAHRRPVSRRRIKIGGLIAHIRLRILDQRHDLGRILTNGLRSTRSSLLYTGPAVVPRRLLPCAPRHESGQNPDAVRHSRRGPSADEAGSQLRQRRGRWGGCLDCKRTSVLIIA